MVVVGWILMVEFYFGCVIKLCILEVVCDGKGDCEVQFIEYFKKGDMVKEVEWLLVGLGWLLELLCIVID